MRILRVPRVTALAAALIVLLAPLARSQTPAPVENVSSLPHRTPDEERRALHVPPGFEIQLVAAEPDIHKPLNLAFDDLGRLWVTDTLEYPYPKPVGTPGRDTVKVLSDFRPDGRAGSIRTFADGLNIPIGLLPYPSGREVLVHNIPNIYLMRDTDGDGRADQREVLYGVIGHRDTHGMTNAFSWGFDGWVYACHGFANDSSVQGKDHRPIVMQSGNTYRMRPDGSHAEYVTHGQVNPFGLAFDPLGNLYSCDCHSRPVYQLIRGAWYPSFGKPDDGLGFGPDMVTHDHGSTGIAGITFYAADQFPEAYRGTVFIGNVVTNRINHDRIEWHGSSPRGIEQPDFVWSEDNWFRPVDIELGPDGALYVADFYNRIIGHYEVPLTHPGRDRSSGRIWRIVYKGTDGKPAPPPVMTDRTKSSLADLVSDLGDANLAVRTSAANQLVARGGSEVQAAVRGIMAPGKPARARVHALWVLQRIGALDDATLVAAARDSDRELRVHSCKVLFERGDLSRALRELAAAGCRDADPFVRRAAAEALGAHPDAAGIRPLLALRQSTPADDTHLIHVARIALRDQLSQPAAWQALGTLGLSDRDFRDIADVATGVHSPEAAAFLKGYLAERPETPENWVRFIHHVARYAAPAEVDALADLIDRARPHGPRLQAALVKAIHQGLQERGMPASARLRELAAARARALLETKDAGEIDLGIELASGLRLTEVQRSLQAIVDRDSVATAQRSAALGALAAIDPTGTESTLRRVLLDPAAAVALRESAAILLAGAGRPTAQRILAEALPVAPGRLQASIAAAMARSRSGAEALLDAIAAGKASARLLQEKPVALAIQQANPPRLAERLRTLLAGLPPADQALAALMDQRRQAFLAASSRPRPEEGASVFDKNCGVCHQIGGKGARVGPQLDGIGSRGLERLVEDILDPNRNVDQAFRVTNLALDDGRVVSGLLLREEGAILVLADVQGKEVRVPRSAVVERSTSPLSPMPATLSSQLSESDFLKLLTFLLSRREATQPAAGPAASGERSR